MAIIHAGKVDTKKAAAKAAGISQTALTPGRLQKTLDQAPEIRDHLCTRLDLLQITIPVVREGKTVQVSAREIFSRGCNASLATLDEHADKRRPSKADLAEIKHAREWLRMAKDFGLFKDDGPKDSGIPAEIANAQDRQRSAQAYLRDHRRRDGSRDGQTLTAPAAQVDKSPADAGPADPGE